MLNVPLILLTFKWFVMLCSTGWQYVNLTKLIFLNQLLQHTIHHFSFASCLKMVKILDLESATVTFIPGYHGTWETCKVVMVLIGSTYNKLILEFRIAPALSNYWIWGGFFKYLKYCPMLAVWHGVYSQGIALQWTSRPENGRPRIAICFSVESQFALICAGNIALQQP
mgnify:CR=1 FL=1